MTDDILAHRERFSWTVNGAENPAVPCTECGSLELKIVQVDVPDTDDDHTAVYVILECRACGYSPMHLGITQRLLSDGSSFVTVTTD